MTPFLLIVAGVLVAAGLALIAVNGWKLISDWPRLKPRHNVDRAWILVYAGVAMLIVAWFIGADPAKALREPMPQRVNPDQKAGP